MTFRSVSAILIYFLFSVVLGSPLFGQGVCLADDPLCRSVEHWIASNQPDSFGVTIKSYDYTSSPKDEQAFKALCEMALTRGVETGSGRWKLEAYQALARHSSIKGDKAAAMNYALEADPLLAYGTLHNRLNNHNLLGIATSGLGDHVQAIDHYSRGIAVFEEAPEHAEHARVGAILYFNRSSCYYEHDNTLLALSDCLKALEAAALNEAETQGLNYRLASRLSKIYRAFGDESVWKLSLEKVAKLAQQNRTPYDSAMAMLYLVEITDCEEEGKRYFKQGLAVVERNDFPTTIKAGLLYQMGKLYERNGKFREQEALVDQLISLYPDTSTNNTAQTVAFVTRSQLLLRRGRTTEAIYWAERAMEAGKKLDNIEVQRDAKSILSEAYAKQKNFTEAYRAEVAESALKNSLKTSADPAMLLKTYLEYQYEQEKKITALKSAQEQALLNAKVSSQRTMIILVVFGLALLTGLVLLLLHNIYLKRRSERSLIEQQQLLLRSNEQLKQFTGIVSHDILSNLELIIATGNILVGTKASEQKLRVYFENTQKISAELKSYCIDLLTTARKGQTAPFTNASEAEAIVKQLLDHYADQLAELRFEVATEPMPDLHLPPVVIEQFLHNGITNALKYVPQPGKTPHLRIGGGTNTNGEPYLFIEDNGPGIDAARKETFLTGLNTERRKKSQGVGLAKLRKHLQVFDHALRLEDAEGGGLRLVIC